MVKKFKELPYEIRLKKMGIYSLDRWRLRADVIETGKEHLKSSKFFNCQMSPAESEDIH